MESGQPKLGFELFDQQFDSFDEVRSEFEWAIPSSFNAASYMVDRWADSNRDNEVAVYYDDRTANITGELTFEDLAERTNQFANYLEASGIERGDRIAVNSPRKIETLIAHLGAWKRGAVSVPLSTLFGPEALEYRLEDSSAAVCIIDESNLDVFQTIRDHLSNIDQVLTVGADVADGEGECFTTAIEGHSTDYTNADTEPEDPLVLMYTSGTTGPPKGVIQNHEAVAGHIPGATATAYNFEIWEDDVLWSPVEWSWAGTLTLIAAGLFFGRAIVAYEDNDSFDPHTAFELIERYDITLPRLPPSALRMMRTVDDPTGYDLDSVRLIGGGGESPSPELSVWTRETFDAPFHEAFGQTEAWNLVIGDCTAYKSAKDGWIGFPLPGHDLEIIDTETGDPLGPGEIGEIALHRDDPIVFERYLNNPEKTEVKFQDEWLLTEDLGERDEEGRFRHVSRKDDVILCSGYKIGPDEVESALEKHEATRDVGVIGVPDDTRGEVPKAFVQLSDGRQGGPDLKETLQSFVQDQLAAYEYPRQIEFVDELPVTTTGKISRADLRKQEEKLD